MKKRSINCWILMLSICILAGVRRFVMSSPLHFTGWMPSTWFHGEAIYLTQRSLNVACSWLFLVVFPVVGLLSIAYQETSFTKMMIEGFLLRKPVKCSRAMRISIVVSMIGGLVLGLTATAALPSIRDVYPRVRAAGIGGGMFLLSCTLTFGLILATELFYRGIALSTLHKYAGVWAVYLLVPVYILDHVGAPLGEVIGSGFVGIMFGHLALYSRSIWPGFAIHVSCALMVDISSLWWDEKLWFV